MHKTEWCHIHNYFHIQIGSSNYHLRLNLVYFVRKKVIQHTHDFIHQRERNLHRVALL